MSNLYLLVFHQREYIKIGKADDIHARIVMLQRVWGPVDYAASYYLAAPLEEVRRVEGALLSLLSQFAMAVPEGDGKTELRARPALPLALQYLDIYCASMPHLGSLQKGVSLPSPRLSARRRIRRDLLLQKSKSMTRSISALADRFGRINRLLTLLYRRQARIPYEWDRNGSRITFRMRKRRQSSTMDAESRAVIDYFNVLEMEDMYGRGYVSFNYFVHGASDVVQFTLSIPTEHTKQRSPAIDYFIAHSLAFLERLPTRSAAAVVPIPVLE